MTLLSLRKTYRSAQRARQIVNVFLRHGFGSIIDQIQLGRYIPFRKRLKSFGQWSAPKGISAPERLRMSFAELGPSFIKLAQILSARPDLITPLYANEFKKLQDKVPPFPGYESVRIVEEDCGRPIGEVFECFDEEPVAAASIAQVHYASLHDGRMVIVKVRRPNISTQIEQDIDILTVVARLMENNIPESRHFNPSGIVKEFGRTVRRELDFMAEARNCQRLGHNLRDVPGVHIPEVIPEYLSERMLVMERIDGVRIDDVPAFEAMGIERHDVCQRLVNVYLKMILEDGFFHADPHPGNIFVTAEGTVCLMDFGIVGRVSDETREVIASTFMAMIAQDIDSLVEALVTLGYLPEDADEALFRREFRDDLADIIEPLHGVALKGINFSRTMEAVVQTAIHHRLRLPSEMILISKTMMMMEGLVRDIYPEFNFVAATEPYAKGMAQRRLSPRWAVHKAGKELAAAGDLLLNLPRDTHKLVKKAIKNDIGVKMTLHGMDQLIRDMDRSSNRVAFAMVISAIILSSAVLFMSGKGPSFYGMPIFGFLGFGFASILGLWLVISIIRSGRM